MRIRMQWGAGGHGVSPARVRLVFRALLLAQSLLLIDLPKEILGRVRDRVGAVASLLGVQLRQPLLLLAYIPLPNLLLLLHPLLILRPRVVLVRALHLLDPLAQVLVLLVAVSLLRRHGQ